MVNRCPNTKLRPLTVVDLDGTLVRCNTLERYIVIGLRHNLKHLRLFVAARIALLIALRKLRLISHHAMKFSCLSLLSGERSFHGKFANDVLASVNNSVIDLINQKSREGQMILLATAAPDFYVPLLWHGDYVATQTKNNPDQTECRGEEKLSRVIEFASAHNLFIDTVISDHHDDAPLFRYNTDGSNVLVNPTDKTLRFFREFQPTKFFLIEQIDDLGIAR